MCHVTAIVSGIVSLGVLAGILSGLVYVILVGLKWAGKVRLSIEEESVKGGRERTLSPNQCAECGNQKDSSNIEEPCESSDCNDTLYPRLANHIRNRNSRKVSRSWNNAVDEPTSQSEDFNDSKTVQIREQIENLVEKIVGGSLDGVSVGRLSKHAAYLGMFAKHHDSLCQGLARLGLALHVFLCNGSSREEDSPVAAQAALKSLIDKVVAEAMKLPNIKDIIHTQSSLCEDDNDIDFTNKSYEDILATAILNKVIEQCQKRQERQSGRKHKSSVKCAKYKHENNNNEDDIDALYHSDWSDTSRSEQLSLTIEEHIEEITTTYENTEEEETQDEMNFNGAIPFPESGRIIRNGELDTFDADDDERTSATELITSGNSWEENWLFQKKRLRPRPNSHHPVPVPMLVPNPSQDFRALIGGVDANDLSDMSECSDSVLEDIVLAAESEGIQETTDMNEICDDGQKPEMDEDSAMGSPTSLISESSCPSFSQKERDVSVDYEYFQKLEIELPDRPLPRPRSLDFLNSEENGFKEPLRCRTAEREKEKWNNPVPLAHNPYSAENIAKRQQRRNIGYFRTGYQDETFSELPSDSLVRIAKEPIYEIYSRDYYIKASRRPTGDPNFRSSPVNDTPEPFVEVSEYFRRDSIENGRPGRKFECSDISCEDHSEGPLMKKHHSFAELFLSNRFGAESVGRNHGSHSLRIPARKREDLVRRNSDLADLEHRTLRESVYRIVFRPKNASENFVVNPLFEDNGDDAGNKEDTQEKSLDGMSQASSTGNTFQKLSREQESGYCSSDSSELWRLTPPETPEMLESSLITAYQLRKSRSAQGNQFYGTYPKSQRIQKW